jgi:peptidoglycan biosynthesis protein MviN/MurJ (putative lipid II flippase)
MGLIIALPIGLICGLAKPLLILWLGPSYADLSWLVVVLVSHLCINIAVVPLFSIQASTNHVRLPGILTLVMGLVNTGLAVALAMWSGWGYISIAIAGAIVLTAKNAIFTPLYNARILHLPWWTFMVKLFTSTLATLLVGATAYWVSLTWTPTNWLQLGSVAATIGGIYVVAAYFLGLGSSERFLIKTELRQRFIK